MDDSLDAILTWYAAQPTLARAISAAAKLGKLPADACPSVRIAILRNITLEPGLPAAITVKMAQRGLRADVLLGEFDNVQQEAFGMDGSLYEWQPDIVAIALRLQTVAPKLTLEYAGLSRDEIDRLQDAALARVESFVSAIRARTSAAILVHNFEVALHPAYGILDAQHESGQQATVRALNARLAARVGAVQGAYILDVDHLLAQAGYERALDDRYWHIGRAPYTFEFQQRLAAEYTKFAAAFKGKSKKCLVLDCDNTLWGGVVGEDGLSGIKLGRTYPGSAYFEFHAAILDLYQRGILLAINSKNNPNDALEVFEKHPDSLLKPEHFVAKRINWQDKATNLREIASELNIGLDSLVFVDDNPVECNYVAQTLPEVEVIQLPPDPTRYARLLRSLPFFETATLSDEDRRRSEMYRAQAKRSELKETSGSMEDYLRSLDMTLTIGRADAFSIPRIAQLTQKTNQFTVTTRRYTEGDIAGMAADAATSIYYAQLRDRFDDSGIVAVAIVVNEERRARIDTFLMSCRVIGRGVEEALLENIALEAKAAGNFELVGEFLPTPKNGLASALYERAGFVERAGSSGRWWELDLQRSLPAAPAWFAAIRTQQDAQYA